MNDTGRVFAVIPAAGRSTRMGRPKLLLPFRRVDAAAESTRCDPNHRSAAAGLARGDHRAGGDATAEPDSGTERLIDRVLRAWTASCAEAVVVVVRRSDTALQEACRDWPVHLVTPASDPEDMKESIQCGLRFLAAECRPTADDACLLAPADLPGIHTALINRIVAARSDATSVVVPEFGSRPGHPILIPWPMTDAIFHLPADRGIDVLIRQHNAIHVPFPAADRLTDVDTPAEYETARRQLGGE